MDEITVYGKCPECGHKEAVHKTFTDSICVTDTESHDGYKTIELHPGFIIECPECGFWDGEPPQY